MAKKTLCTNCDNCRADKCIWASTANMKVRIPGWKVEKVTLSGNKTSFETLRVLECPKYIKANNKGGDEY